MSVSVPIDSACLDAEDEFHPNPHKYFLFLFPALLVKCAVKSVGYVVL